MFNWYTGRIVDAVGYTPVFIAAGVLGPLGLVAMLLLAGHIHRLPAPEPVRAPRT
jgi:hypothetical protein